MSSRVFQLSLIHIFPETTEEPYDPWYPYFPEESDEPSWDDPNWQDHYWDDPFYEGMGF